MANTEPGRVAVLTAATASRPSSRSLAPAVPLAGAQAVASPSRVAAAPPRPAATRLRTACRMVEPIHSASAATSEAVRKPAPDSRGTSASFWAMPTWKGFTGLNAEPTKAAPALIASAVTASKPSRRDTSSTTGISGMISSCMFSRMPPRAKGRATIGISSASRWPKRRTSASTAARSAPVASTTVKAPPIRNTRNTTSAASAMPRGIATAAANRPTGAGSTRS